MWNNVWEELFSSQAWGKYPAEPLIRFVARNFYSKDRASIRILELGCGPGANLWYLAREGFSFKGIDGSASAIEQATNRLDAECPGWRERGQLEVGDITKVDLGHEAFDAIIDNECVYCMSFELSRDIYARAKKRFEDWREDFCKNFYARNVGVFDGVQK